ncbi:Conserved hypothetical protein [gamma proteobacterium HdN1]|nr:Conserved hypothetical protein [gamma proteobacterium HdN1]
MSAPEGDWKVKYLDLLDELERTRQLEKKRIEVLRKGVVRVSVAADGQDDALDAKLAELRAAMRAQGEVLELEPLIFRLENAVKALDYQRKHAGDEIAQLLSEHVERYEQLPLSRTGKNLLRKFRQEFPELLADKSKHPSLWRAYTHLTDTVLAHLQERLSASGEPVQPGFFQRLLGGKAVKAQEGPTENHLESQGLEPQGLEPHEDSAVPEVPRAPTSEDVDIGIESGVLHAAHTNGGQEPVADGRLVSNQEEIRARIRRALLQLLEQVDIPAELLPRKERLIEHLAETFAWDHLPNLLVEAGELFSMLRNHGQREFEAFLRTLHERLQEIQEFLAASKAGQEAAKESREQLDADVRSNLQQLQTSVQVDKGMPAIRDEIESVMKHILGVMDEFRTKETGRQEAMLGHIHTVVERMHVMEREALELKQALEQQQSKAMTDALTGLPNRQAYDDYILREFSRWKRRGHALSMAVIDIDFFKRINDTLGHLRGDKVLKLVAREIQDCVRSEDFVARYGGEEFVALLPDTDQDAGRTAMEKVRQHIEVCPFNFHNQRVVVTVSIGVAQFQEGDSIESVFDRADQALYRAKGGGRNRVELG